MTKDDGFRWQSLFQRVREPLFVLSRQRRLLFVNRAWEELTGVSAAEARGLACTRRAAIASERSSAVTRALWPPAEVLAGKSGRARRQISGAGVDAPSWWDIEFFPLRGEGGLLCILGRIQGAPLAPAAGCVPFPQALQSLHDRIARQLSDDEAKKLWRPERLVALRERLAATFRLEDLDTALPSMRRIVEQARLASRVRACVYLIGEPGTGKRWLARAIHLSGPMRERVFAAIDCTRLSAAALADALFGSLSLCQRSSVGTLYLKEPSRLPHDLQTRLLEWLEHSAADDNAAGPRVIAGSSVNPAGEVRAGRLQERVYGALATVTLELPALRERLADLPNLTERMLARLNDEGERRIQGLATDAWELCREYGWPGNLRELQAVLADCHARATSDHITVADLPASLRQAVRLDQTPAAQPDRPMPLDQLLEQAERRLIEVALRRARGNKSRAADILAIWRPRLLRRMEALGISRTGQESSGPEG
jgi:DNA-binding NtrC family response regulator